MHAKHVATQMVKRLVDAGYIAYFAGGWVRDYLLKSATSDIDIATSAPPQEVMRLFSHTIPVGINYGVVIVVEAGYPFEVSSFRKDGLYIDGRHPDHVEFSTPEEDASRHDFTINGMFYDPLVDHVYDFVEGRQDLERRLIRAIGDPRHRFHEDRLRMVRAIRLAARFRFAIDPDTEAAIQEQAASLLPAVAIERVWQEFRKMADYPHFDEALIAMHRLGLLQVIFPELSSISLDEIKSRVASFAHFPPSAPLVMYLMELFPDLSVDEQVEVCRDLKATNQDITLVERMGRGRQLVQREETADPPEMAEWAHFYALPLGEMLLEVIGARYTDEKRRLFQGRHRCRLETLLPHINRIRQRRPLVSAQMLRDQGIMPGKVMGSLLKEAERISINDNLEDSSQIIHRLKKTSLWPR
jgi:poly(A) polymerase